MNKEALNWLTKRMRMQDFVRNKLRPVNVEELKKIRSSMDLSAKRIANPSDPIEGGNNEYARIFLNKVQKETGTMDEFAVRKFIKDNPKISQQLLVNTGVVDSISDPRLAARAVSSNYEGGMLRGPVAYERAFSKINHERVDKLRKYIKKKNKEGDIEIGENTGKGSGWSPFVDFDNKPSGGQILLEGTKRGTPLGFAHETFEGQADTKAILQNLPRRSIFARKPSLSDTYQELDSKVLGSHVSPEVLQHEFEIIKNVPTYAAFRQADFKKIMPFRRDSREYDVMYNSPVWRKGSGDDMTDVYELP